MKSKDNYYVISLNLSLYEKRVLKRVHGVLFLEELDDHASLSVRRKLLLISEMRFSYNTIAVRAMFCIRYQIQNIYIIKTRGDLYTLYTHKFMHTSLIL